VPLSEVGDEYVVDPVRDLRPVCPNCHAMIHTARPPLRLEDITVRLARPGVAAQAGVAVDGALPGR
jgi:predicted HNH restriction endonuclease